MRLVPTRRLPFIIAEYKIALGVAMASGLLLLTLSGVRIAFLTINPRDRMTVSISLIRILSLLLLGGGLLGFTSHATTVIPGIQGSKYINPILRSDVKIVTNKFLLNLLLYHCIKDVLYCLADNVLLVGYVPGTMRIHVTPNYS